jgi:hypothetical protein
MPPVEVPAMRSKSSQTGLPVRRSISESTIAGMMPRMPPPSMLRILNFRLTFCLLKGSGLAGASGRW